MRNEKAGFVEHVTFELEFFLLDKLVNLQPVIETELMAGVMRRQAGLAFRLHAGYGLQHRGALHGNLHSRRNYKSNDDPEEHRKTRCEFLAQ